MNTQEHKYSRLYFDVFVDGAKKATIGHEAVENLSISVSGAEGTSYLFASGVCKEAGDNYHLSWLDQELSSDFEVMVRPTISSAPSAPIRRYKMGQHKRSTQEDRFCDFCKLAESELEQLIYSGDSPGICSRCISLCAEIARGQESSS